MTLRITILGSGTSSGVPRIGGDWGACDPSDPRNRRTRVSLLVQSETTTILVDTSPDMRAQLLAAGVIAIDAVLWTHDHADHSHGIDDLRQVYHHRRRVLGRESPIDGFARAPTMAALKRRFGYVFEGAHGYVPTVSGQNLPDQIRIGDIDVHCVDMPHGAIWSTGFRFTQGGKSVGYATDFHEVRDDMLALFEGVDIWVVDALREAPHPTHPHLALTLEAIEKTGTKRAYLTHMDQSLDYRELCARLPDHIRPGYDGLVDHV